jgi:pyruvate, water dikinase
MKYIRYFNTLSLDDIKYVGGKNAALGQMIQELTHQGIRIPNGFAITSEAYWDYITENNLKQKLASLLKEVFVSDIAHLKVVAASIRSLFVNAQMPDLMKKEIAQAYTDLSGEYDCTNLAVAVRSSATAEDLPDASFAGQQETFLNIQGIKELIIACKKSFASLFTDRAIVYRQEKGFDHMQVALSIGVQKMVNAESAGVAFSLDTETGFKDIVMINGSWGLGESIVKGLVIPDEFVVFTPKLQKGLVPIVNKKLGSKKIAFELTDSKEHSIKRVLVSQEQQNRFCLDDTDILELAYAVVTIEQCYSKKHTKWTPVDVEWAKDRNDGRLYILQARPETIHSLKTSTHEYIQYTLVANKPLTVLAQGTSIGSSIVVGRLRVIPSVNDIDQVQEGDIIVTQMSDPDWVPVLKRAKGIITQEGGRTCHAAIISRELGIPAIVGLGQQIDHLKDGQEVTLDCSQGATGYVYKGGHPFDVITAEIDRLPELPVKLLVNIGDPDRAFTTSLLPVEGVGLARIEFIISNSIKVHPMALVHPEKITDNKVIKKIDQLAAPYHSYIDFFIDTLSYGIGTIAAAFYPRSIIVRFSDFKTNEYANLLGGSYFEEHEENPMLGFRGASRYYDPRYQAAFALECAAIKKVREHMGLDNVAVMVPFVRTTTEAERITKELLYHGIVRGEKGLQIWMMAEVPANVLLVAELSEYFDGFSIGSNDLTQLTLGIDRDSSDLQALFDERDPALLKQYRLLIQGARNADRRTSICGQAPSDFHDLSIFLIDCGIDSISLNTDAVLPFLLKFSNLKKTISKPKY